MLKYKLRTACVNKYVSKKWWYIVKKTVLLVYMVIETNMINIEKNVPFKSLWSETERSRVVSQIARNECVLMIGSLELFLYLDSRTWVQCVFLKKTFDRWLRLQPVQDAIHIFVPIYVLQIEFHNDTILTFLINDPLFWKKILGSCLHTVYKLAGIKNYSDLY